MDSQYQVGKVTHVIDPSNIWLQLSTAEFCELETDIQKCFHNEKPATQIGMVQPEQFVIAHSSSVDKWLRARISRVMGEKADLFYLDYGFAEQRPLNKISTEFPPRFSQLSGQALHCRLYGIEPLAPPSWINRAGKVLSNAASGQNFVVFFHCSSIGKYVVSLYNIQTLRSIIHELLESEVCKLDGEVPIPEYLTSPSIPYTDTRGFAADPYHNPPKVYPKMPEAPKVGGEEFTAANVAVVGSINTANIPASVATSSSSAAMVGPGVAATIMQNNNNNNQHPHQPHPGVPMEEKSYWNRSRIPSADLSVFDVTAELTPEKLVTMDKMHQFRKAQQEVQNIFNQNSEYMLATTASVAAPVECNYSSRKTLPEVMTDVQSQIQEMYTDKRFHTENTARNIQPARFEPAPTVAPQPTSRSQDIWAAKTCSVPPGFQPLGSAETNNNNCPRRNFDDFTTWSPSFEPRQQPSLSPSYLKLVPQKSSPVLVPPSMFNSNPKTEQPKPNLPRSSWSTSWGSNSSHSVIDTNLTELAQKLQKVLPSAHSNVHWPQLYWEMEQLFLDFRELSCTQKLNLILKQVLTQAIHEPNFFNNAITLIFYFRDYNNFESSLRTTITDLEVSHIKVESPTADTFADLLGHIFVDICSRNSQCSFTPFRTILTKWLNFSNPNNSSQSDNLACKLYQHSFLDFWTVAGVSCLQKLSAEFAGFLRREMKSMILSTGVDFTVRSRLFSILIEQEQTVYSQNSKPTQTVAVQTDLPVVPDKVPDLDPARLSPSHNVPMYQQNGDSWCRTDFSSDPVSGSSDYDSQTAILERQFSALYAAREATPDSPPLTPPGGQLGRLHTTTSAGFSDSITTTTTTTTAATLGTTVVAAGGGGGGVGVASSRLRSASPPAVMPRPDDNEDDSEDDEDDDDDDDNDNDGDEKAGGEGVEGSLPPAFHHRQGEEVASPTDRTGHLPPPSPHQQQQHPHHHHHLQQQSDRYLPQRYDMDLKRPMALNLFEPYFLEKTLESAAAAAAASNPGPNSANHHHHSHLHQQSDGGDEQHNHRELSSLSSSGLVEDASDDRHGHNNSELLRGSYAARVADSSGDGSSRSANSRSSGRGSHALFDYSDDHHMAAIRNNARDIGNGKIRFVAKRLVPEKSSGGNSSSSSAPSGGNNNSSNNSNSSNGSSKKGISSINSSAFPPPSFSSSSAPVAASSSNTAIAPPSFPLPSLSSSSSNPSFSVGGGSSQISSKGGRGSSKKTMGGGGGGNKSSGGGGGGGGGLSQDSHLAAKSMHLSSLRTNSSEHADTRTSSSSSSSSSSALNPLSSFSTTSATTTTATTDRYSHQTEARWGGGMHHHQQHHAATSALAPATTAATASAALGQPPDAGPRLNSRSVMGSGGGSSSSNSSSSRTQSCSQEIPCYQCTICGRTGHQSHQCPNHSKYFFM
ncbi:uncharacterized protein LOC115218864 isoform X2 [Argonauta hians]